MHRLLAAYYRWKKENVILEAPEPVFFEFTEVGALAAAELTFYKVGVEPGRGPPGARRAARKPPRPGPLDRGPSSPPPCSTIPGRATNAAFIRGIDIDNLQFDPAAMAERLEAACRETSETYAWRFAVPCMARFRTERLAPAEVAMEDRRPWGDGETGFLSSARGFKSRGYPHDRPFPGLCKENGFWSPGWDARR